MNVGDVITIGQDALWTAVLVASPLLGTALVLGVVIGVGVAVGICIITGVTPMAQAKEFMARRALVAGCVMATSTTARGEFVVPESTSLLAQRADERHVGKR